MGLDCISGQVGHELAKGVKRSIVLAPRAFAILIVAAGMCIAAEQDSPKELAMVLARKAARAEKAGQSAQAYIYYAEASALQPRNSRYRGRMVLLQTRAHQQAKPKPEAKPQSQDETPPASEQTEPEKFFDSLTERELSNARELLPPPVLKASPGTQTFDLDGDPRVLFDKVAAAFGLQTVFDGDYPTLGQATHFKMSGVNYRDALHGLEAATSSFVIPISSRVLMVARDTLQKRNELEQTIAVSVPVPQFMSQQELTEVVTLVRQASNIEKVAWDTSANRVVMRDRISRVVPAVELMHQLLDYRPEVMVDLQFIQVSESDLKNYGFNVTDTISAYYLGKVLNSAAPSLTGVTNLMAFGGGRTLIGLGVAQAQAMFNENMTTSSSLYQAQIRSLAGMPATIHVGEKYPVLTGGYFGNVPAGSGTVFAPPPSFTYENLGLELKVTPFVHGMGEVSLGVETSFEVLSGQAINNIPVIGRRDLKSQVRLHSGEWAVIGGIMSNTDSKAVTGFEGLAQLPLLGYLFRQTSTDKERNMVLIALRPRVLSLPPDQRLTPALWVGSEARPHSPL